ncbi:hypothetical protein NYE67_20690 [Solibacillus sp. FSL W8-0474]|uniref:hypothetical protein n=1 Tax=Solibacillus sp. FSL W8-0474 TaxID=2975336 RepID=UPI0030F9D4F9
MGIEVCKAAAIIKQGLDKKDMNGAEYGVAARYALYYLANSFGNDIKITEEVLLSICDEGFKLAKQMES